MVTIGSITGRIEAGRMMWDGRLDAVIPSHCDEVGRPTSSGAAEIRVRQLVAVSVLTWDAVPEIISTS